MERKGGSRQCGDVRSSERREALSILRYSSRNIGSINLFRKWISRRNIGTNAGRNSIGRYQSILGRTSTIGGNRYISNNCRAIGRIADRRKKSENRITVRKHEI